MKDEKITKKLGQLKLPNPSPQTIENVAARSRMAFEAAKGSVSGPLELEKPLLPRIIGFAAAATVMALIALALYNGENKEKGDLLAFQKEILKESVALFPESLKAIIFDNDTIEYVMFEDASLKRVHDQPIRAEFTIGDQHIFVIMFSGQSVSIPIAGYSIQLETILTNSGKVILMGDQFAGESSVSLPNGIKITAEPLAS